MLIRRWSLRGAMRRLRDRDRPSRGEEGRRTRQTSARPERNEGKRRSRSRSPHFSDRDDGDSTHRTLLLTDLDGTLVDHHSLSVDAEIKEFFGHWDSVERTRGSLLCYNTARAASDYRQLVLKYEHGRSTWLPEGQPKRKQDTESLPRSTKGAAGAVGCSQRHVGS